LNERRTFLSNMKRRYAVRKRAARLRRNEDGSVAIEFAIIAPVFFFLMFVIAETALVFVAEQVMDNAVFETARLIRTGQVQNAGMSKADFTSEVCGRVSIFIDCGSAGFYLDVKSYPTFDSMNAETQPVDADGEYEDPGDDFEFGSASEIVVVRAYYQWPLNPIVGRQWPSPPRMANGKMLIGSFTAFRNEPFTATASAE
jgi:Flp pilus assembly protein TadG